MNSYRNNPISEAELKKWESNRLINPRTHRKIKENGRLYKYINQSYQEYILNKKNKNKYSVLDSTDERDPISLQYFYKLDENGKKVILYKNPEDLVIYKETDSIIRCFEKESIRYLKTYKMKNHPISSARIPDEIFDMVEEKELNKNLTLEEKALQVFQIFTHISIFIDYKHFCNLSRNKVLKLNYELKDLVFKFYN